MARKRHKPKEIVAKLRPVDVLTAQGQSIAEAVRTTGVTETTYFRWRAEYSVNPCATVAAYAGEGRGGGCGGLEGREARSF